MGFRNERSQLPGHLLRAGTINGLVRGANTFSRTRLNPHLQPRGFWAKLSGSSSPYSFQEVIGSEVMGTILWTVRTDGAEGTGDAYELNGVSGLDAQVAYLERNDAFEGWSFEYPRKGTGGGTITVPGCPCTSSPVTIHMTVTNPTLNNHIFNSCTLQYGPTPSSLLPVVLLANSYLSTATFFDPILGVSFYYFLTCTINSYVLTRVYPSSPFGSPFRDSVRYKWVPGFPGNTCTPFSMTSGQIFLGGDPRTTVTISG